MKPVRLHIVELVDKDESTPVLVTFDAEEASNLAEVLNEVRLQNRLDDDDAEPGAVAVVRKGMLIYEPCPRSRKEVLA